MEIEFNGIIADNLQKICDSYGITSEVFPLARRDTICSRKEGRAFGDGETYYFAEESCWHGYFFCGGYNCGRSSRHVPRGPSTIRTTPSTRSTKGITGSGCAYVDCGSDTDCDSNSDSLGAFVIFFLIIAAIMLLLVAAPYLVTAAVFAIELGFTILLGLFDLLTFGIFRKKFKRVLIYFPKPLSDTQLKQVLGDAASLGGIPRRFGPQYGTNGFLILRTGAYLFLPSVFATILVLVLQPQNGFLFRVPIIALILSIVFVWLGNMIINRKAKQIARSL